jgi:hypothetical protein
MNDKTVRDAMLDAVLNQINTNDPPEARDTYDRLVFGGRSNSQALQLMSAALKVEMERMLQDSTPFDNARYSKLLQQIPDSEG